MNTFLVLGTALIAYTFFIRKLSIVMKNKYLSEADAALIKIANKGSLTGVVKRVLDFFLAFFYVIIVIWPVVLVVMAISQGESSTWGFDIPAFTGFSLNLELIPGLEAAGLRHPEIGSRSIMIFDTSNLYAWYLFASTQLISAMVALFVVIQLIEMVKSLQQGLSFTAENAQRIKRLGITALAWNVVTPFVQYFGWGAFISEISFNSEAIQLYPAFELNVLGLVFGLLLMLLSSMLIEAAQISKEQELTI